MISYTLAGSNIYLGLYILLFMHVLYIINLFIYVIVVFTMNANERK